MADETPTLRLELGGGELNTALGWTYTYLYLGDSVDAEVDVMLPNAVITALAAALDPATTARLFDQRDAAITERDQLRAEVEDLKFSRDEADLDPRLRTELAASKLVPRCGNTVDSVLSDTPHFVCDLPYGCDQWYAGSVFPTRAEWVERTERSELEQALVEVERMRPVLEAARAWRTYMGASETYDAFRDLVVAVDVYNQPPSPDGGRAT